MYFELDENEQIIHVHEIELEGIVAKELIGIKFIKATEEEVKNYFRQKREYKHFFIYDGQQIDEKINYKITSANNKRKLLESSLFIYFKERTIKIDDKTIFMLNCYLSYGFDNIKWKCLDGWVQLSSNDIQSLIKLMLEKKQEVFNNEFEEYDS